MGELVLVLIITCIVCGGVPLFAFVYMNGKQKKSNRNSAQATNKTFEAGKSHPKVFLCVALMIKSENLLVKLIYLLVKKILIRLKCLRQ